MLGIGWPFSFPALTKSLEKGAAGIAGRKPRPGTRYSSFLEISYRDMSEIEASSEPGSASSLPAARDLGFTYIFVEP